MNSTGVVALAVFATIAICLGSLIVGVSPGDGQTGMVAFPLWFLGGSVGIGAVIGFFLKRPAGSAGGWVAVLAVISLMSVVWAFDACAKYEEDWRRSHPASH